MKAMLLSHKVIDGEVYNAQQYLQMKRDEHGGKLNTQQKQEYREEFEKIEDNLLDSIIKDPDTGMVTVKEGVNWVLGLNEEAERKAHGIRYESLLKKNKELRARMHGINKRLNGAYADFDAVRLQRKW
jgi:hypothetical protein